MQQPIHDLSSLFSQLGLDSSEEGIDAFVRQYQLPEGQAIYEADFWNEGQKAFLREAFTEDADWVPVVDELAAMLGG
ncbi:MAG: DUF2789 domain-containing protein [Porticoccaceae bacterium]